MVTGLLYIDPESSDLHDALETVDTPLNELSGADLTPGQINVGKVDYRSPYRNLWLVGATAGVPSFAGAVHFANLLYERLTGDNLRPAPG